MSFRDSEFVQNEIKIINALQDRLAQMTMAFPQLSPEERDEYVQILSLIHI